ncbi:hypothetical protein [Nonomuraea sp. NPDC003709]|uniref:hypothetical protein n=1 Tax=Nonomuraea sp. NPDC003709 TaxID=3154450 RepID=UPI0033AF73A4
MATDDTEMRDHWWRRPGWRAGCSFCTWYVLVGDHSEFHAFARHVGMFTPACLKLFGAH